MPSGAMCEEAAAQLQKRLREKHEQAELQAQFQAWKKKKEEKEKEEKGGVQACLSKLQEAQAELNAEIQKRKADLEKGDASDVWTVALPALVKLAGQLEVVEAKLKEREAEEGGDGGPTQAVA